MGFRPRGRKKQFPIPVEGDWKFSRAIGKCAKRLGRPQTNLPIPLHNNFTATGNSNGCWAFALWARDVLFDVHVSSYKGARAPLADVLKTHLNVGQERKIADQGFLILAVVNPQDKKVSFSDLAVSFYAPKRKGFNICETQRYPIRTL